jgi:hypothetical protein
MNQKNNQNRLVSYNGHQLSYVDKIKTYDREGKNKENKKMGRDADGKLCLEQGKYIRTEEKFGEKIHWYLCKDNEIYGVKQKDIDNMKEV